MRKLLIVVLASIWATGLSGLSADDRQLYEGLYWNEDKSIIMQLKLKGDSIEGTTVWSNGENSNDINNPDPILKKRPVVGMVFLWDFVYSEKKNRWKDGQVYDPDNGKTYDAKMSIKDNEQTIVMRGYIGISLFGRTAEFMRLKADDIPVELANITSD